jgi:hypothetical protein
MGAQGTQEGLGRKLILDAAALIGFERENRMVAAIIEEAHELGGRTVIPASVLGQVWRGGPRAARLAKLVAGSDVDALEEGRAKEIGERLGVRDGSDVVNAHVVCCAVGRRAAIVTSDPEDTEALIEPGEAIDLVRV